MWGKKQSPTHATDPDWHFFFKAPPDYDECVTRDVRSRHVCQMTDCHKETRKFLIQEERNIIIHEAIEMLLTLMIIIAIGLTVYFIWYCFETTTLASVATYCCQNANKHNITRPSPEERGYD